MLTSDLTLNTSKSAHILVREIMSAPVVTASEKASIKEIATKMKDKDIDTVIIVNEKNEPVGMVTEGDIVRRLLAKRRSLWFTKAKHVMSKPVVTAKEEEDIEEISKRMAEKKIKRICVVNDANKLVGIVTQTDIIENTNYLINILKEMLESGYGSEEAIGEFIGKG